MSDSRCILSLTDWEYQRGFQVGIARFTANWGNADAAHYDRSRMEEDRNAQAAAALCEIAVARFTNQYWHGHVWHRSDHHKYRNHADVGDNIEVRRVRTANAVCVRRTDAGRIVYAARTVDPEYRQIELLGYLQADDAIPLFRITDKWAYVPLDELTKPWETSHASFDRLVIDHQESPSSASR